MKWALKGDFAKNVLTLMTGSTVAQAIPVAISPVLTRIYTPEDFGILAIFMALTAVFGSIANGRYELAIMLPDDNEDAINIAALGVLISTGLSLLLLAIAAFFNDIIVESLGNEKIKIWLYFVPVTVWFLGLFNVLRFLNSRLKNYKAISQSQIYKSVVLAAVQLGLGGMKMGVAGLISGQIASAILANGTLLSRSLREKNVLGCLSFIRIKLLAKRFRHFPYFSMPAILANSLAQHLVSVLVSVYFSVSTLGLYALVQRVLGMPTSIVGTAVGQVFFQRAAEEKKATNKAVHAFDDTVKIMLLISFSSFFVLFLVAEPLFAFVFGDDWRIAGVYAKILVPFFAVRFVVASVSTVNSVFEKQKISLIWQIFFLFSSVGVFFWGRATGQDFESFLYVFSGVGTLCYLILYMILRKVSRNGL